LATNNSISSTSNSRSTWNISSSSNWTSCISLIGSWARNNIWTSSVSSSSSSSISSGSSGSISTNGTYSTNSSESSNSTLNIFTSLTSNIFFSFRVVNNLSLNW
jgi:hypothetical protein